MAHRRRQSLGGEVWTLASAQHGVVTHTQLLELGFTRDAIKHRIRTRRLHPVWRGIYAVGRPDLTRHGLWMAAVLACGPGAVLSHDSAAELWELLEPRSNLIHVSARHGSARRLRGIRAHRRQALEATDVTEHRGIPVTAPICTLIDIAPTIERSRVEAAVTEGDKRDLLNLDALRAAVDAGVGRSGVGVLRTILDRRTFCFTDSELERRFLPIARRAGLPKPATQAKVNGFRVDFYWADLGLVVETDGLRYHRTPTQQARDRLRDQTHTAAGLTSLRFTHGQVRYEPERVEAVLTAIAARLIPKGRSSAPEATIGRTTDATSAGSSGLRRPRAASGGRPSR